jgi:hypothetical protein
LDNYSLHFVIHRTFISETQKERTLLIQKVYPSLRKFCQTLGYEFQAVDMHWGMSSNAGAKATFDDEQQTDPMNQYDFGTRLASLFADASTDPEIDHYARTKPEILRKDVSIQKY